MLLLEIAIDAKNDVLGCTVQSLSLRYGYNTLSLSLSLNFAAKWQKAIYITCNWPRVNSISRKYVLIDIEAFTDYLVLALNRMRLLNVNRL